MSTHLTGSPQGRSHGPWPSPNPSPGPTVRALRWPPGYTAAAGAFYMFTAGIHAGIVAADAQFYRPMAEQSPWGFVRVGWAEIFMAHPHGWGLFAAALEAFLGVLLLTGGRASRVGWVGIIAFQVALVLFGWGFLLWSVPFGMLLVLGARHDWRSLTRDDKR